MNLCAPHDAHGGKIRRSNDICRFGWTSLAAAALSVESGRLSHSAGGVSRHTLSVPRRDVGMDGWF